MNRLLFTAVLCAALTALGQAHKHGHEVETTSITPPDIDEKGLKTLPPGAKPEAEKRELTDRQCGAICANKLSQCISKCPKKEPVPLDKDPNFDVKAKKFKQPPKATKADDCATQCVKDNDPCMSACK